MELRIMPKGNLQIDNARITYRNFEGRRTEYNDEGRRNFSVIIESAEDAERLINLGYNVKIKPPRQEGDPAFMTLKVNVSYRYKEPTVILQSGRAMNRLTEDTVRTLDAIEIEDVCMDISPSNWSTAGRSGLSAYLTSIKVVQNLDRFAEEFNNRDIEEY